MCKTPWCNHVRETNLNILAYIAFVLSGRSIPNFRRNRVYLLGIFLRIEMIPFRHTRRKCVNQFS